MLRFLLALSLIFCSGQSYAQYTKSAMQSQINSTFPDNSAGAITPAAVRTFQTNLLNSYQQYTGVNAQVGTSYTFVAGDYGQLVTFTNSGTVNVALPKAILPFFPWNVFVRNLGSGNVVITPTTSTIGGASTLTLTPNQQAWIISDGTNYQLWIGGTQAVNCPSMPALTGDVTTTAGSCVTTVAAIQGNTVNGTSGTGLVAFNNSPTFITPTLGVASATTVNKLTITTPASGSTLTILNGKTLTIDKSLEFDGTDSTKMTFPATSATVAGLGITQTWTAPQTFTNSDLLMLGSSTGFTTFASANAGASNFTITFPAATGTVALVSGANVSSVSNSDGTLTISPTTGAVVASIALGHANVWTGAQTFANTDFLLRGTSTGSTTLNSGLTGAGTNTLTLPITATDTIAALGTIQTWTAAQTFSAATTLNAALTYGGVTLSNSVTGTGSMVLSASPTFTGTITGASESLTGSLLVSGTSAPTLTNGKAGIYASATNGALYSGQGSTNDVSLVNSAGSVAANVPTGTTNFNVVSTLTFGTLSSTSLGTSPTTVTGLTANNTPNASNDYVPYYSASDGAIRKITVGALNSASVAGVSNINGLTGGITITGLGGVSVGSAGSTVTLTSTGNLLGYQTFCASGCTQTIAGGGTGTYTPTSGTTQIIAACHAGGGGGGASAAASDITAAGGGGEGELVIKHITGISGTYTIAIGAGGTAGSTGPTAGGAGGDSTFATTTLVAKGGSGGAASTAQGSWAGGAGGTGGTGDIKIKGARGNNGQSTNNIAAIGLSIALGGFGGGEGGGSGQNAGSGGTITSTAGVMGGGGGGASSLGGVAASGQAGGAGYCTIQEFS